MESLQRTFTDSYTSELKQKVKDGNIADYIGDSFTIQNEDTNVYRIQGLLTEHADLDAEKSDYENALALYEALKGLSPLIASEEAFWTYLTHGEYFRYVKDRWFRNTEPTPSTIKRRFFYSGSAMDNALSRLWWSVYLTIDRDPESADPYKYTKVILKDGNSDLLQNLSKSRLYRLEAAVRGILGFFSEYETRANFSEVNRFIVQYFNRYSGVKQLVYMSDRFFYNTSKQALAFYKQKNNIE